MSGDLYSRRDFLNRLGWLTTLGTFGGLTAASARYIVPNVLYEPPKAYRIDVPSDYPEGINYLPDKRIYLVRQQNLIRVVSAVCTHIGCTAQWVEERDRWECPCHGSIFDKEGIVVRGPAAKPLPWYQVTLAPDGRLFVNQGQMVSFEQTLTVKL